MKKFLGPLKRIVKKTPKGDTERTDPPVSLSQQSHTGSGSIESDILRVPRSQSQSGFRPSDPTPPTLRGWESDGK
jgi:hypothetical protein